jgi:hypothetical protein
VREYVITSRAVAFLNADFLNEQAIRKTRGKQIRCINSKRERKQER